MQTTPTAYIQVTAALISLKGRLFVAQRPPSKASGLYWEFPGGKVEPGESLEDSLIREIKEELGWDIRVEKPFKTIRYGRESFGIDLHSFWCSVCGGELELREHVAYRWACLDEIKRLQLTEADRQLVLLLEKLPQVK